MSELLDGAIEIINTLNNAGYEAYLVGGYVRDHLLSRESKDIDITTSATVKELTTIFKKYYSKNKTYQTVTVFSKDNTYEVTTFRKDKKIIDHRHQKTVVSSKLSEDLKRRDFTINALCMDKDLKIIDLVHGVDDLNNCIIRAVGDPKKRFREDALRILRAFRFASRFDFEIEAKTLSGIDASLRYLHSISQERIKTELEETITNAYFKDVLPVIVSHNIYSQFRYINIALNMLSERYTDIDYVTLMCIASLIKGSLCEELPLTRKEKKTITQVLDFSTILRKRQLTKLSFEGLDDEIVSITVEALGVLGEQPYHEKEINSLYKSTAVKSLRELDVTGSEIIKEFNLEEGPLVKEYLNDALRAVLIDGVRNKKKDIFEALRKKHES